MSKITGDKIGRLLFAGYRYKECGTLDRYVKEEKYTVLIWYDNETSEILPAWWCYMCFP